MQIDPIINFNEFKMCGNLIEIITLGLGSAECDNWSNFIKRGFYDPRLFIFIFSFLDTTKIQHAIELENYERNAAEMGDWDRNRFPPPKKSCITRILYNRLVWQSKS